ncbi:hypothetical protein NMG60_11027345 [Bertholletia excelsa]
MPAAREINVLFISSTRYYWEWHLCPPQPTASPHDTITILVPVLLKFIELEYQGMTVSPFETNSTAMWVAVAGLSLYSVAYEVERRCPARAAAYSGIISLAALLCWSLSAVSLTWVLLPGLGRVALLLLYALLLLLLYAPRLHVTISGRLRRRMMGRFAVRMRHAWMNRRRALNRELILPR